MIDLIATHRTLIEILSLPAGLAIGVGIAALALWLHRDPIAAPLPSALLRVLAEGGPRHLLDETAEHGDREYEPRHATDYLPRHEADAAGTAVVLGARPDGDITFVHADPPAEPAVRVRPEDEITVRVPALVGAAA